MKKEIIKPFDLEAYKKGAKIQTRDGHEVRIICTDVKSLCFPIIALVEIDDSNEIVMHYTSKGKINSEIISNNDLIIVEEVEEVPEFWSDDKNNTLSGFYINNVASIAEVNNASNTRLYYDVFATKKQAKSAIAMARISQIMANDIKNFGGVVTDEEWDNGNWKYVIFRSSNHNNRIGVTAVLYDYQFLAFHTEAQRDLFLEKYRDLVKEYLMID